MERHDLMGGRVYVFKRPRSPLWQCGTFLQGGKIRASTRQSSLEHAKAFAEQWYLDLLAKDRSGDLKRGRTFRSAAETFLREYEVITQGQRSKGYVEAHKRRLDLHLLPFFGSMVVAEITPGTVQEYRMHRIETTRAKDPDAKPPARSTMHKEMVVIRQVLQTAQRHGWLPFVPNISPPYKTSGKIGHRAWFSPEEYERLYKSTRRRAKHPPKPRWKAQCENLHDYVLFMVNTGLRPDEARNLQDRDATIIYDKDTDERIVLIEVRGKRGVGYCKSTAGAVRPLLRLRRRNKPKPTDRLFPSDQRELFNAILREENLKYDRDGNARTSYSLRHTYICLRLLQRADIYQIAKNCRTSVDMIEKHYAVHLKTTLDAAAINRRTTRPRNPERHRKAKRRDEISVGDDPENGYD